MTHADIYDRFGSTRNQLFNKTFSYGSGDVEEERGGGISKVFPVVYHKVVNK